MDNSEHILIGLRKFSRMHASFKIVSVQLVFELNLLILESEVHIILELIIYIVNQIIVNIYIYP